MAAYGGGVQIARLCGRASFLVQGLPPGPGDLRQVLVTTDPFGESTVLLCEFSYPARGNRHAVIARLDPLWHDRCPHWPPPSWKKRAAWMPEA